MALTETDRFLDLGSGRGEVVSQVFLQSQSKEARGIEILPHLHQSAVAMVDLIRQQYPLFFDQGRILKYELGDFLQIPLGEPTVIFVNALCFGQKLLYTLGNIFNAIPTLRMVLAVRPLPSFTRLPFQEAFRLECSWDSARCCIYSK